jgi:hypothetical protein
VNVLRQYAAALAGLPDRFALGIDRWVLRLHSPVPIDGRGLVCMCCRRDWPCPETARVVDRHPEWGKW